MVFINCGDVLLIHYTLWCMQQAIYHPESGELVTNLLYEYEGFWLALLRHRSETLAEPTVVPVGSEDVEMKESGLGIMNQLNLSYQFDLQTTNNGQDTTGYTVSGAD